MSNTAEDELIQVTTNKGRWYEAPDGSRYPSVTTILKLINKDGLVDWAKRLERDLVLSHVSDHYPKTKTLDASEFCKTVRRGLPKEADSLRVMREAGSLGSDIHERIEAVLRGSKLPSTPLSDEGQRAFQAFLKFWETSRYEPVLIEKRVVSRIHGYAGMVDLLATLNGTPILLDWKCANSISYTYILQVAAYWEALAEMGFPRAESGLIVRLPKEANDNIEFYKVTDLDEHFNAFKCALQLHRHREENDPYTQRKRDREEAYEAFLSFRVPEAYNATEENT